MKINFYVPFEDTCERFAYFSSRAAVFAVS